MGDGRNDDAKDESWTQVQDVQPDAVEVVPIRHGMVLAGRYAVEKIIGRGGSGVVVRAHDRDLRAAVAIKIVRAELAGQRMWTERLAREVRLARQIHHPHVCRVFDFQQADGRAFLVMELAGGGSLRDEMRSGALAARPVAERIADARAVASALEAIHRAGIVHRDLSPQNLLRMDDGRLVMSDFGLAIDVSDTTSSVYGGTVAYMAPEVLRGGKASFASDVWGLGIVMHEMVFGVKPRWSDGASPVMLEPRLRRPLTREERAVFETCRACTAKDPAHRLVREGEVVRMLAERRPWWRRRLVARRRTLIFAGALALVAAAGIVLSRPRHPVPTPLPTVTEQSALTIPVGEPMDWTDLSSVLAQVPDRINCTRLLPDQRTIRFVWGSPPRVEEIDIVTHKRVPSRLVPAAYAEGCPDLSPDGKRLVYQGHTPDGRAFAFLSEHPDGREAVPMVQTAEPSMSSEPTWLPDGNAFSYDIDERHPAVFSLQSSHTKVMPEAIAPPYMTAFRFVAGDLILVSALSESGVTDLVAYTWPALREQSRFRTNNQVLDVRLRGTTVYYTQFTDMEQRDLLAFQQTTHVARRLGRISRQVIRYPLFVGDDLVMASLRQAPDLYVMTNGRLVRATTSGDVYGAAHCGADLVVGRVVAGHPRIERLDTNFKSLGVLVADTEANSPQCSPTGDVLFYIDGRSWTPRRCDQNGCKKLADRAAIRLAPSPDGTRIAAMTIEKRGLTIWWVPIAGGDPHEVTEADNLCAPGWASDRTLWISRRVHGKPTWTEVDADSGRETGKTMPGSRDCSDGRPDPDSPVNPDLRIIYNQTSQLRLLDGKFLARN
jgi:serine/threonine protein kinase